MFVIVVFCRLCEVCRFDCLEFFPEGGEECVCGGVLFARDCSCFDGGRSGGREECFDGGRSGGEECSNGQGSVSK